MDVDETLKRIQASKGVVGVVIVNAEGMTIRTTLDNSTTVQYAQQLKGLCKQAQDLIRDLDPHNDATFLRIRTKKQEFMVAPENDYAVIVVQSLSETA